MEPLSLLAQLELKIQQMDLPPSPTAAAAPAGNNGESSAFWTASQQPARAPSPGNASASSSRQSSDLALEASVSALPGASSPGAPGTSSPGVPGTSSPGAPGSTQPDTPTRNWTDAAAGMRELPAGAPTGSPMETSDMSGSGVSTPSFGAPSLAGGVSELDSGWATAGALVRQQLAQPRAATEPTFTAGGGGRQIVKGGSEGRRSVEQLVASIDEALSAEHLSKPMLYDIGAAAMAEPQEAGQQPCQQPRPQHAAPQAQLPAAALWQRNQQHVSLLRRAVGVISDLQHDVGALLWEVQAQPAVGPGSHRQQAGMRGAALPASAGGSAELADAAAGDLPAEDAAAVVSIAGGTISATRSAGHPASGAGSALLLAESGSTAGGSSAPGNTAAGAALGSQAADSSPPDAVAGGGASGSPGDSSATCDADDGSSPCDPVDGSAPGEGDAADSQQWPATAEVEAESQPTSEQGGQQEPAHMQPQPATGGEQGVQEFVRIQASDDGIGAFSSGSFHGNAFGLALDDSDDGDGDDGGAFSSGHTFRSVVSEQLEEVVEPDIGSTGDDGLMMEFGNQADDSQQQLQEEEEGMVEQEPPASSSFASSSLQQPPRGGRKPALGLKLAAMHGHEEAEAGGGRIGASSDPGMQHSRGRSDAGDHQPGAAGSDPGPQHGEAWASHSKRSVHFQLPSLRQPAGEAAATAAEALASEGAAASSRAAAQQASQQGGSGGDFPDAGWDGDWDAHSVAESPEGFDDFEAELLAMEQQGRPAGEDPTFDVPDSDADESSPSHPAGTSPAGAGKAPLQLQSRQQAPPAAAAKVASAGSGHQPDDPAEDHGHTWLSLEHLGEASANIGSFDQLSSHTSRHVTADASQPQRAADTAAAAAEGSGAVALSPPRKQLEPQMSTPPQRRPPPPLVVQQQSLQEQQQQGEAAGPGMVATDDFSDNMAAAEQLAADLLSQLKARRSPEHQAPPQAAPAKAAVMPAPGAAAPPAPPSEAAVVSADGIAVPVMQLAVAGESASPGTPAILAAVQPAAAAQPAVTPATAAGNAGLVERLPLRSASYAENLAQVVTQAAAEAAAADAAAAEAAAAEAADADAAHKSSSSSSTAAASAFHWEQALSAAASAGHRPSAASAAYTPYKTRQAAAGPADFSGTDAQRTPPLLPAPANGLVAVSSMLSMRVKSTTKELQAHSAWVAGVAADVQGAVGELQQKGQTAVLAAERAYAQALNLAPCLGPKSSHLAAAAAATAAASVPAPEALREAQRSLKEAGALSALSAEALSVAEQLAQHLLTLTSAHAEATGQLQQHQQLDQQLAVACDLAHKAADIQLRHAQTDAAATSARSLADGQLSTAEAACDRQRRLQQAARQRQRQQLMDSTHIDLHAPRGPAAPTAGVTASPGSPFGLHRPAVRPDSRLADYGPRPAGRGQLPPGSSTSMRPAGGSMSTGRLSPVVTRARTWFDSPLAGQCAGTSTPSIFEGGTSTPAYAASMRGPLPPAAHAVGSSIGSPSRQYRFASPTRQYSPGSPSRQYMAIAGSPLRQHADRGSSYYHSARTRLFQTGSDNAGSGAESGGAWQSVTSSRAGMSDVGPAGWAATVTDQLQMVAQKAAAEAAALGAAAAEQHGKLQQASDAASAAVAEVSVTAEPFLASAEWLLEGQQQYVEALVLPLLSQAQQLLGQLGSTCPSSSSSGQAAALIRPPAAAAAAASAGQEGATGSFLSACPPAVSSRTAAAACWGYLFPGAGGQADSLASRLAQGCSSSGAHSRGCTPLARPWLHSPAATPLSTATRHGACSNSSSIGGGGGIPSIMWGDSCWAPPCPTHPPRPGPHLLDVDFASHSLDWLLRQQAGQAVDGQLEAADARIGRIEQLQGRFGMENLAGARAAANQARKELGLGLDHMSVEALVVPRTSSATTNTWDGSVLTPATTWTSTSCGSGPTPATTWTSTSCGSGPTPATTWTSTSCSGYSCSCSSGSSSSSGDFGSPASRRRARRQVGRLHPEQLRTCQYPVQAFTPYWLGVTTGGSSSSSSLSSC